MIHGEIHRVTLLNSNNCTKAEQESTLWSAPPETATTFHCKRSPRKDPRMRMVVNVAGRFTELLSLEQSSQKVRYGVNQIALPHIVTLTNP